MKLRVFENCYGVIPINGPSVEDMGVDVREEERTGSASKFHPAGIYGDRIRWFLLEGDIVIV